MYRRPIFQALCARLTEPRRFLQIIVGPRQVGKTTLVHQLEAAKLMPMVYASADEATARDPAWIETHWQRARQLARRSRAALLAIDEIQKVPGWSEVVKAAWDADHKSRLPLRVLLLGSTPLFAGRGIRESLAGRFETLYAPHWSPAEMAAAFRYTFDDYLYFGGYPGAASLRRDATRWRQYMRDSIIEATVARDLLATVRVDKPALLRQLFFLTCEYAGQILSYTKMLGQLQDAGNTTTLAHYLDLLSQSGLATGMPKISVQKARARASSPKLLVLDPSLMTATRDTARADVANDLELRGRLIENIVGGHLWRAARQSGSTLYYWAEGNLELDYVYTQGKKMLAVEVKSGRRRRTPSGLGEFARRHPQAKALIVGTGGVPVEEFLASAPEDWLP